MIEVHNENREQLQGNISTKINERLQGNNRNQSRKTMLLNQVVSRGFKNQSSREEPRKKNFKKTNVNLLGIDLKLKNNILHGSPHASIEYINIREGNKQRTITRNISTLINERLHGYMGMLETKNEIKPHGRTS